MGMNDYEVIVGLEVHAELCTETKIFCGCKNAFGAEVNTLCCPVCMGMPGTLPVLNKQVVDYAIKMGHALNCRINRVSKNDRKNYFYPDLPKAYQISQFDIPLCEDGYIDILVNGQKKRVGITRIHIEEDAGKLIHDDSFDGSLVDFNRCGVPLIEMVSEPDLRSAEEAKAYLEAITSILLYLGTSDAKMQEGSGRADVNVSVRKKGSTEFGTRTEMKNVNSFGAVYRAIQYEAARQVEVLENGGVIEQETRRWDDAKGCNFLLRSKEDAQDYRYFPEPDLLTFEVSEAHVQELKDSIPELPVAKTIRYMQDFGLNQDDASLLASNKARSEFFDSCVAMHKCDAKLVSNWVIGDIARILNERRIEIGDTALTKENLTDMICLIEKGTISNTAAKTVLETIIEEDVSPAKVVEEKGLAQVNDADALQKIVNDVLAANQKAVADYKGGKTNVAGFLVGQCMKATKGKGNPATLREMVVAAIEAL